VRCLLYFVSIAYLIANPSYIGKRTDLALQSTIVIARASFTIFTHYLLVVAKL
jgi:hypothetical protein